jgi:N-acetylglucosaminyl-diphospho-decaprenol L-rhamnosyltransferase
LNAEVPTTSLYLAAPAAADLCVILVTYNSADSIARCVDCLRDSAAGTAVRVIIIDNASRDDTVGVIKQHCPDCTLIENKVNVGFGRANNQVLHQCRDAEFVLLLNPDAFVENTTIAKSLAHMRANPDCGILGVKLIGENGEGGDSAFSFPRLWGDFARQTGLRRIRQRPPAAEFVDCDWVPGCYYLIRRTVIDQIGLFDPRYFLYFEEVDHCVAAKRAGWKVQFLPTTRVIHEGGASAQTDGDLNAAGLLSDLYLESELAYFRKHKGLASVFATILLGLMADMVGATKSILKGMPWSRASVFLENSRTLLRVAIRSRLGLHPSR